MGKGRNWGALWEAAAEVRVRGWRAQTGWKEVTQRSIANSHLWVGRTSGQWEGTAFWMVPEATLESTLPPVPSLGSSNARFPSKHTRGSRHGQTEYLFQGLSEPTGESQASNSQEGLSLFSGHTDFMTRSLSVTHPKFLCPGSPHKVEPPHHMGPASDYSSPASLPWLILVLMPGWQNGDLLLGQCRVACALTGPCDSVTLSDVHHALSHHPTWAASSRFPHFLQVAAFLPLKVCKASTFLLNLQL